MDYLELNPLGELFFAPCDVRLFPKKNNSDQNVLIPDILVICDPSKTDKRAILGGPDLVIEILSPSTTKIDKTVKNDLYKEAGVKEYWTVSPDEKIVTVHILKDGEYVTFYYDENAVIKCSVLPGCEIDMKAVFAV